MRALVPLLALALLAGCVSQGLTPEGADAAGAPDARAIVPGESVAPIEGDPLPSPVGHDHAAPEQHAVEANIDLASYPMIDPTSTFYAELDVQGDWLAQCSGKGVLLWDVSTPDAPVLASTIPIEQRCADVKMSDDGTIAVAASEANAQMWDVSDKREPRLLVESDEVGCHMCAIHAIGGKEYLVSGYNGRGMSITEIQRDPPALTKVGEWGFGLTCAEDPKPWLGNLRAPDPDCLIIGQFHDMYVYDDPLLNKTIAVPAYWDLGMWFVDISDPANPTVLGNWQEYMGESGDIHTTSVDFLNVGGEVRRIAVAASETGPVIGPFSTLEPSSLYVFDATELDDIQLLARWTNPGKRPSGAQGGEPPIVGEFSTHNVQFEKGRVYLAHYHGGVWVLDVQAYLDATGGAPAGPGSHLVGDEIPVLGVYNTRGMDGEAGRGMVWDVVLKDGFLYASDEVFGLFVLHFQGDPQYDPAWTSDA